MFVKGLKILNSIFVPIVSYYFLLLFSDRNISISLMQENPIHYKSHEWLKHVPASRRSVGLACEVRFLVRD